MEDVAPPGRGPRWFQLYWSNHDELAESFVRRAEASGCEALVVTLDTHTLGWRPRDLDLGYLPFAHGLGIAQYTADPVFAELVHERVRRGVAVRAVRGSGPPRRPSPPCCRWRATTPAARERTCAPPAAGGGRDVPRGVLAAQPHLGRARLAARAHPAAHRAQGHPARGRRRAGAGRRRRRRVGVEPRRPAGRRRAGVAGGAARRRRARGRPGAGALRQRRAVGRGRVHRAGAGRRRRRASGGRGSTGSRWRARPASPPSWSTSSPSSRSRWRLAGCASLADLDPEGLTPRA